jgi:hypothetical protein
MAYGPGVFEVEYFTILYTAYEDEVPPSECAVTDMTNSYWDTGGGFNIYLPGIQVTGANQKGEKPDVREQNWAFVRSMRNEFRYYHSNFKNELNNLRRFKDGQKSPSYVILFQPLPSPYLLFSIYKTYIV